MSFLQKSLGQRVSRRCLISTAASVTREPLSTGAALKSDRGRIHKIEPAPLCLPSKMIYLMINEMIFRANDRQLASESSWRHIITPQISYFGDAESVNGLLQHIGKENPFYDRLIGIASKFGPENPKLPFHRWAYVEPDFGDLVSKMTNLDPRKRITAQEALQHEWFSRN